MKILAMKVEDYI